jgi:hypothetical protein
MYMTLQAVNSALFSNAQTALTFHCVLKCFLYKIITLFCSSVGKSSINYMSTEQLNRIRFYKRSWSEKQNVGGVMRRVQWLGGGLVTVSIILPHI